MTWPKTRVWKCIAPLLLALGASIAQPPKIAMADEPRTAKERLTDKASDDQRTDNCGVPPERRGSTLRPGCSAEEEPSLPAAGQGKEKADD